MLGGNFQTTLINYCRPLFLEAIYNIYTSLGLATFVIFEGDTIGNTALVRNICDVIIKTVET